MLFFIFCFDVLIFNLIIECCFAVVSERNALALARSPFCVQLFYSLQTVSHVFLVCYILLTLHFNFEKFDVVNLKFVF